MIIFAPNTYLWFELLCESLRTVDALMVILAPNGYFGNFTLIVVCSERLDTICFRFVTVCLEKIGHVSLSYPPLIPCLMNLPPNLILMGFVTPRACVTFETTIVLWAIITHR